LNQQKNIVSINLCIMKRQMTYKVSLIYCLYYTIKLGLRQFFMPHRNHVGARSTVPLLRDIVARGKILQPISASAHFVREHGFEYISLKEVEDNPIIGKVVFSFRRWK